MVVPKKKHTPSAVGQRRSHHALKKVTLSKCPQCGKAVKPHTACAFCGTYKGRQVLKVKVKSTKKKER
jgi:large subunit ribosomal protein L32